MQGQYSPRSPAVKRLMKEAQELSQPTEQYHAAPLDDNLFEWHFTLRGPPDSDFDGGIYHGRIVLPHDYPMKPPSIILLTPNGRFETNKKICLSISGYHPESWQPSWSIRTALLAIIGFMPTHGNGAIGSLDYTKDERRVLVKRSHTWKCTNCGDLQSLLPPVTGASQEGEEEAKKLAAQINFKAEKEKVASTEANNQRPAQIPSTNHTQQGSVPAATLPASETFETSDPQTAAQPPMPAMHQFNEQTYNPYPLYDPSSYPYPRFPPPFISPPVAAMFNQHPVAPYFGLPPFVPPSYTAVFGPPPNTPPRGDGFAANIPAQPVIVGSDMPVQESVAPSTGSIGSRESEARNVSESRGPAPPQTAAGVTHDAGAGNATTRDTNTTDVRGQKENINNNTDAVRTTGDASSAVSETPADYESRTTGNTSSGGQESTELRERLIRRRSSAQMRLTNQNADIAHGQGRRSTGGCSLVLMAILGVAIAVLILRRVCVDLLL